MNLSTSLPADILLARCLLYSYFQVRGRQILNTVENIVELMEHTQGSNRIKKLNKPQIGRSDLA